MKLSLYLRLAFDGIRKNKRFYLPYLLTCVGMTSFFFVIDFLRNTDSLRSMKGYSTFSQMMPLGCGVVEIFALLFLFYSNSFLLKRRKKEFGLYNMLGMSRKNLAVLLLVESITVYIVSIFGGILCGALFSKAAEFLLLQIVKEYFSFSFSFPPIIVLDTVFVFGLLFFILYGNGVRVIRKTSTVTLLKSENEGEKEPKSNRVLGIGGAVLLCIAYVISLVVQKPLTALLLFFGAVILVIIGTYLCMISGSVLLCKKLQNNKKYYYQPKHFVLVSSVKYRMKRNGAGLASICILATMVLVMISSSASLYFGKEETMNMRYPRQIISELQCTDSNSFFQVDLTETEKTVNRTAKKENVSVTDMICFRQIVSVLPIKGGKVLYDEEDTSDYDLADAVNLFIMDIADYNKFTGENMTLPEGKVMLSTERLKFPYTALDFGEYGTYEVTKTVKEIPEEIGRVGSYPTVIMWVNDLREVAERFYGFGGKTPVYSFVACCEFNTNLPEEKQSDFAEKVQYELCDVYRSEDDTLANTLRCRADEVNDYYGSFGTLFFLGILLSTVFMMATVLIIYYKQISEGFEDVGRFSIMQKVGMTDEDIKKSIRAQLRTVFFAPLFGAALHMCFAFVIIKRILLVFSLTNTWVFLFATLLSFALFALIYGIVYKITSHSYYKIIKG